MEISELEFEGLEVAIEDMEAQIAALTEERDRLLANQELLREGLRYARRFLNSVEHDVEYVDGILASTKPVSDGE